VPAKGLENRGKRRIEGVVEEQFPRQFGKYTLLRRLAVGGMAEIFLALQRSISGFEKLLVIKRILPQFTNDDEFLQMFLDEARIAATLNHPNIVQIYDVGSVGDAYFIAMEYVQGEDLRSIVQAMQRQGTHSFPLEHALQVVIGVCAGLEHAHCGTDLQGRPLEIVHRDVSPQNILVTFTGDVKLVDFGIARAKLAGWEQQTHSGQLRGKAPYMSPEQGQGLELDRRSDLFSAGIVLFELTTGRRLFRGENQFDTLRRVASGDYPRPSAVRAGYPPVLEAIVVRALALDRDERYQRARDLQGDLEEFVRHQQLPSSSLAMAHFMGGIFADQLARQGEELAQGKRAADRMVAPNEADSSVPSTAGSQDTPLATAQPSTGSWHPMRPSSWSGRVVVAAATLVAVIAIASGLLWASRTGTGISSGTQGQMAVLSQPPGATIVVDGQARSARTPHVVEGLRLGRTYQLRLSLEGYRDATRQVRLNAGHPRERVYFDLLPASKAMVEVTSEPPGAKVYIDGREHDEPTPTTIAELNPGSPHSVLLKLSGYGDGQASFRLQPGEVHQLSLELEETPLGEDECALVVQSEPPGAEALIQRQPLAGVTPVRERLACRSSVLVEVRYPGFRNYHRWVNLRPGREVSIRAQLEPYRAGTTKGRLYFDAVPFCNVSIDGRPYGPTPLVGVQLSAGDHRVVCSSPPIGVTKGMKITIPPRGTVRRRLQLTR
jgi:serine/threonine-protein kinase